MNLTDKLWCLDHLSRSKLRLSLVELICWAAFSLLLVIHCVENTSLIYQDLPWMDTMYLFRNLLYLVLLFKAAFLSVYRPKELWCVVAVLLAGTLCFICSGDFTLMEFAIIVIAAKDISPRSLVNAYAVIKTAAILLTLTLAAMNILPNIVYENGDRDAYYTYGFCHRNVLGANMAVLCLAWLYLRYQKMQRRDLVLWGVLTVVTYLVAVSRTSLIIMVLTIVLVYGCRRMENRILKMSHMRKILLGFFLGLFLLCLVCTVFYARYNEFWEFVDKIFTKRLRFSHQVLDEYGFSLFGQEIKFVSTLEALNDSSSTRLILDNAFMRALLYNGIIPGGLFLAVYCKALDRAWLQKNLPVVTGMLVMAVYGMSERFMMDVNYNFPLLMACLSLFRQQETQSEDAYRLPFEYALEVLAGIWKWCRKRLAKASEVAE